MTVGVSPAQRLDRLVLGSWVVVGRAPLSVDHTGSAFSVGYIVESSRSGKRAFLKALDFEDIIRTAGPAQAAEALQFALNLHNYEVRICERCRGIGHVVAFLEAGTVFVEPTQPLTLVPYLIFEQADGDVRAFLRASAEMDVAWVLRCMHNIAAGLQHIHAREIAHQDLKPSNILLFGREFSKIGDFGRASDRSAAGPYDEIVCAGATPYAPPELLYGHPSADWRERRFGCDLYLLGSMLVFFFAQTTMTALLLDRVPEEIRPARNCASWPGDYDSVLPVLQRAFGAALDDFGATLPAGLQELRKVLQYLCDPDPIRRGYPRARAVRHGNPFDLQYFVSRFDALARRAEARIALQRLPGLRDGGVVV